MNKRILRRVLVISLLSLAGFFVLVTTVNQQIVHQQARDLRREWPEPMQPLLRMALIRKRWQSPKSLLLRLFRIIPKPPDKSDGRCLTWQSSQTICDNG